MPLIHPVIHVKSFSQAMEQMELALQHSADGVFFISHEADDDLVVRAAIAGVLRGVPGFKVGVNLLSTRPTDALSVVYAHQIHMLWLDNAGVTSQGLDSIGQELSLRAASIAASRGPKPIEIFAGVAFKYQPHEPHPVLAANLARDAGFVPVTSGPATGHAPDVDKLRRMSHDGRRPLAVASGMTPENVGDYAPFLTDILVATGVSLDEHHLCPVKLNRFMHAVRSV